MSQEYHTPSVKPAPHAGFFVGVNMTIREKLISARTAFQALEPVIVDGFAMISPWLSAVFPAALTGWNVSHYLTADWGILRFPVAIVSALAVESLGISATHSAIKEWAKGRNTNAGYFRLAMVSGFQYLIAIIAANVLLEAAYVGDWPRIVAKAILATLTIPGALVIAIRAQSAADDLDRAQAKIEKKLEKLSREKTDKNADNSHAKPDNFSAPVYQNAAPDRKKWVTDYMEKTGKSQASAYRAYKEQFEK